MGLLSQFIRSSEDVELALAAPEELVLHKRRGLGASNWGAERAIRGASPKMPRRTSVNGEFFLFRNEEILILNVLFCLSADKRENVAEVLQRETRRRNNHG
jgi:hypothetical protein